MGGALGVEKGSLEKVSKLCSGLSKWTSISGHLTLIVPVRVCMPVCVCMCVCTMVMNGFTVREREKQEERKQSFNRAQYQTADRQRTAGRFWKGEKSLPPSHFSSQRRLPKCPPSNTNTLTHTHKWHHNSISAINLRYEDASIFSNVNGRVLGVGGGGGQG